MDLADSFLGYWIVEGRYVLGDVGFGTLLGAFISALIACLKVGCNTEGTGTNGDVRSYMNYTAKPRKNWSIW
ncbi:MAG: hypothetical protein RLZZ597_1992 [Cyanobacteriota bacterium]|jgi:hypothetical protein